jgi:DNA-binding response OmpR family regulator
MLWGCVMATVLLVDRDADTRAILALLLRCHGIDVAEEPDPDRALAAARVALPRLIVADHPVRLADGTPLIPALRRLAAAEGCRILAFSARYEPGTAGLAARAEGADDFLAKPADVATLRGRIAALLDLPLPALRAP